MKKRYITGKKRKRSMQLEAIIHILIIATLDDDSLIDEKDHVR